jgi:predicted phosphoribosyltransferase
MLNPPLFKTRTQAGEQLAQAIKDLTQQSTNGTKPIVYALPRGGLPVAVPIARLLDCPLTIKVAKKISHLHNPELAIGAVTDDEYVLWAEEKYSDPLKSSQWQEEALYTAIEQAKSLEAQLSVACPQVNPEGSTLILVDDGVATGMTMAVAAKALRNLSPAQIWLCAPVAPVKLLPWLKQWGDRLIFLATPERFVSVSHFYSKFPQLDTQEAFECLHKRR